MLPPLMVACAMWVGARSSDSLLAFCDFASCANAKDRNLWYRRGKRATRRMRIALSPGRARMYRTATGTNDNKARRGDVMALTMRELATARFFLTTLFR